ncbi:MAG: serine/threonine protein kinase [Acidobacteria bacterium]|nr:MAG: serine/threonine protein kinase [Acidobacteriota bacterium]
MGAVVGRPYREQSTLGAGEILQQRFKILRFIARGGAGEVYEAFDLELRCPVALKIVRPEVAQDELAIERFRREIALARQVTHPNVSRIFDVFRHGIDGPSGPEQTLFLTMELLVGETLSQRIQKQGPMTPDEALPVIVDMVEGLKAAHRVGIIHRDFKSANVMLARQGDEVRAVITDFGLARGEGPDSSEVTNTGIVVGTPYYMAPEQLTGDEITPAADVYSLGIVIYEMLTGRRPFTGSNEISTAIKRLTQAPPSPRILRADLPENWERAILRCLKVDRKERLTDLDELVAVLAGTPQKPLDSTSIPIQLPEPRPVARRGFLLGSAAALVIGLVATLAIGSLLERIEPTETLVSSLLAKGVTPQIAVARPEYESGQPGREWLTSGIARYIAATLGEHGEVDTRVIDGIELSPPGPGGAKRATGLAAGAVGDTVVSGSYGVDDEQELVFGEIQIRDDLRLRQIRFRAVISDLHDELDRVARQLGTELGLDTSSAAGGASSEAQARWREALGTAALAELGDLNLQAARWLFERSSSGSDAALGAHFARTLWRLGDAEEARRQLRRAREDAPAPRHEQLVLQATTAEIEGDVLEAERAWSALFEFYPEVTIYGLELVQAQIEAQRWQDARDSLARLAARSGADPVVDLLAARLAAATAPPEAYVEAARSSLQRAERSGKLAVRAAAHLELARALASAGDPAVAFREAEAATALYERLGDFTAAQEARTVSRFLARAPAAEPTTAEPG